MVKNKAHNFNFLFIEQVQRIFADSKNCRAGLFPPGNIEAYPFEAERNYIEEVAGTIESIIKLLKEELDKIESRERIKEGRIQNFLSKVFNHFYERTFFRTLIIRRPGLLPASQVEFFDTIAYTVSFNEVIDRSIFLENWHVPTFGIVEYVGNQLAEQEDFNIERNIDKRLGTEKTLIEKEVAALINESMKGQVIIMKNDRIEYYTDELPGFLASWEIDELKNERFVSGRYRESIIFSYRGFGLNKLIITNQHLGTLRPVESDKYQGYDKVGDFYVKVVDFGTDLEARKSFLNDPPRWLSDASVDPKEQEDLLAKKIWLRIYGTFEWAVPREFAGKKYVLSDASS